MKQITVPYNFTPRDYQLEFFQAMDGVQGKPETKLKRAFLKWHRRCGKDKACLAYMFKEMVAKVGIYYYFLPTYQQGRKIIWEGIDKDGMRFMEHMPGFKSPGKPNSLVKSVNQQEMKMELTNGSVFRVIGTDNVDTIVGTNPIGTVFSEYSLQDPIAWDYIRPILVENGGWAAFNGTPRGRNHMYLMDGNIKGFDKWYYSELQTLWADKPNYTGLVSPEAIEDERVAGMAEERIEQEYGVSYAAGVQGAYYADLIAKAKQEGRIGSFPCDDSRWVDTYWDIGKNDNTAIWFKQSVGGRIVFIDYYQNNNKDISHYVNVLKEKGYRYREHYLPHDADHESMPTLVSTRSMFENLCDDAKICSNVTIVPRTSNVILGINAVRSRFSRYYFNNDNCENAVLMLELYKKLYDPKKQVFKDKPDHDWTSDCADALRMEGQSSDMDDYEDEGDIREIRVVSSFDPYAGGNYGGI